MARHDSKSSIKQDDGLFLLEVLIDKVVFTKTPCFSDKDFRTCVNIECPAVEPLEICDDDPGVCVAKSGGPFVKTFNNGKSCLFSLKEGDISKAMSKFPIKVSVSKALPCGCLPTKIVMGEATIDMTKEFVQARKKFLEDPNSVSYQALKDSFRILAPDGSEAGEIIMFLRISCFGKLIITRFQGAGGPPNLGGGVAGGSGVVDRSCNPRKDFQTTQDPCACGAARGHSAGADGAGSASCPGGGGGLCPPARDPYNSTPCEDPDDPCYCSGPKPQTKQQMLCRNTDQYCLHVPKGALPSMPFCQDLTQEQNQTKRTPSTEEQHNHFMGAAIDKYRKRESNPNFVLEKVDNGCLELYLSLPKESSTTSKLSSFSSSPSAWTLRSKRRSVSFSDTVNYLSNDDTCSNFSTKIDVNGPIFGKTETTVYMTLFDESGRHRTSGTQATASINKCFQATPAQSYLQYQPSAYGGTTSNCSSICSMSTVPCRSSIQRPVPGNVRYSDIICYLGENENSKEQGMGSRSCLNRTIIVAPLKQEKKCRNAAKSDKQCSTMSPETRESKKTKGCSAGTSPSKAVSIKDPEKPCPAAFGTKADIVATISHVKIGPREYCPVHGKEPCQGPKCIVAANSGEEKAPVKISNVNNPRRGVFELVIRRISGAPLARNELMLEWTPPPARTPPCGVPCPVVCSPPGPCRPAKCRMIVCRSSCEPKCCRKRCKKPCGPKPCRVVPCLPPPPLKPCKPCKPCDPPFPFKPSPCSPCPPCSSCPPCPSFPFCSPCPPCPSSPSCPKPKKSCRPPRPCKPFKCRPCSPCKPIKCRPCSPCKPFKPCPSPKPCKSCRPCKPCKPDLASPTPRTSIIFKPSASCRPKSKCSKPRCSRCGPCTPSGPFKPRCPSPPCLSCCKPCKPRKPCGPAPCRRPACKRCKPRKTCKPCPPPACKPCRPCPSPPSCDACPPLPCSTPCYLPSCSSPCFRPCPVGHRRTRKCRSQPKMRAHKKRISPCWNRMNSCPVVRCRSVSGPCTSCCGLLPCAPPVCRPPRCCKSVCSSCCG